MNFKKKILDGTFVKLEPLSLKHKAGLIETVLDGELWKSFVTIIPSISEMDKFIENSEKEYQSNFGISYAIIDKKDNKVVGSTRFIYTDFLNKSTEIGYTFLAESSQKSYVNTESKLLMLTYAFEEMKFNRVEMFTDFLNHNSRRAIERIGLKQEGILRNHLVMPNGRIRDSILFSIISNEWLGVKESLLFKLKYKGLN